MIIKLTQWTDGAALRVNVGQIAYYRANDAGVPPCTAIYIDRQDNVLLVRETVAQIDKLIMNGSDGELQVVGLE